MSANKRKCPACNGRHLKENCPMLKAPKRVVRGIRRPFTITVPELKPGQGVATRTINVPVRISHGVEVLTIEAHEMIETRQMQMMLTRLNEAVRELTGASKVLPSREAKATPDETACSAQPSAPNDQAQRAAVNNQKI